MLIFFVAFTNRINLLNLKKSSGRLVIIARGFFKLPELHMPLKQRSSSLPRNLALRTFGKLLIVLLTKVNLLYFLYVLSFASDKAKLFAKSFSINSNLDDLGISLPVFPSRNNLNCIIYRRDVKILHWCLGGPVLPHGDKIPLLAFLATLLVL